MSAVDFAAQLMATIGLTPARSMDSNFDRAALPTPAEFWAGQGIALPDRAGWHMAKCCFHDDKHASLGINTQSGGFICHSCGTKGGDVLAAHMLLTGSDFKSACKEWGAWKNQK